MQVKAVGIAWYRAENYDRLKALFTDGWKLPDKFDNWLETAQQLCDELAFEGQIVEKAYIDPIAFPRWCRAHGVQMDAQGRMAYANECAAKRLSAEEQ